MAVVEPNGVLTVWDWARDHSFEVGCDNALSHCIFDTGSGALLAASAEQLFEFDSANGTLLRSVTHGLEGEDVLGLCCMPDRKSILLHSKTRIVRCHMSADGPNAIVQCPELLDSGGTVAVAADNRVYAADWEDGLNIYDGSTLRYVGRRHVRDLWGVAGSPADRRLLIFTLADIQEVTLLDGATERVIARWPRCKADISALHPAEYLFPCLVSTGKYARVIDEFLSMSEVHIDTDLLNVSFLPDNRTLVSVAVSNELLLHGPTGEILNQVVVGNATITRVDARLGAERIVACEGEGVSIVNARTADYRRILATDLVGGDKSLAVIVSPDQRHLALLLSHQIRVLSASNYDVSWVRELDDCALSGSSMLLRRPIDCWAWLPDSAGLVVCRGTSVARYDGATGEITSLADMPEPATTVTAPLPRFIVVGLAGGRICRLDLASGLLTEIAHLRAGPNYSDCDIHGCVYVGGVDRAMLIKDAAGDARVTWIPITDGKRNDEGTRIVGGKPVALWELSDD
ncbi:MAG: hypothetical protein IPM18_12890 [Phycisphaerales bacterium]|nr:hypothetical protein [Phycisphaerales bacterium]